MVAFEKYPDSLEPGLRARAARFSHIEPPMRKYSRQKTQIKSRCGKFIGGGFGILQRSVGRAKGFRQSRCAILGGAFHIPQPTVAELSPPVRAVTIAGGGENHS